MRGGPKTLLLALVALLLAMGLIACGGGDSSDSTAAEANGQGHSESKPGEASDKNAAKGGEKKPGGSTEKESKSDRASEAADFTPRQHNDSGGGSAPYKTKGGDNSVQEFGEEAGSSEFDAAATALHNFLDARAEGNWAATCEYISKSIIESFKNLVAKAKRIEDESCAGILEKLVNPAAKSAMKAEAEQANARSLRTEGDEQAFILYTGPHATIFSMPMANEDGAWKVASLSGYPLN